MPKLQFLTGLTSKRKDLQGQTLSEYALVMGLVLLVSLGGLVLLSNRLNFQVESVVPHYQKQAVNMNLANIPSANAAASVVQSQQAMAVSTAECQASGNCADVPASGEIVNVSGANGSTGLESAVSGLDKVVQLAANSSELDPQALHMLTELANSGHAVADTELQAASVWSGTQYTAAYRQAMDTNDKFMGLYDQTFAYFAAHPDAVSADVKTLLNAAANQIKNQSSIFVGDSSGQNGDNTRTDLWTQIQDASRVPIQTVHANSNTICKQGQAAADCLQ